MSLDHLKILDLRPKLAVVPSESRAQRPPHRPIRSVTLHYNGPPVSAAGNVLKELQHIIKVDVPNHQQRLGADSLQYHFVVFSDGQIYQTRDLNLIAWHCGNAEGNITSLAVHLPIGGTQEPTKAQWAATESLCDALNRHYGLGGRGAIRGHNAWKETLCPGPAIVRLLRAYHMHAVPDGGLFRIIDGIAGANVREGPGTRFPVALQGKAVMYSGDTLDSDALVRGDPVGDDPVWAHRRDGLGFVHRSLLIPL